MTEETGHILVVDDNRMNRLKLSISLEQQGHRVSLAEDGEQALVLLKEQSFDVVLLDIIMPGMDGFQVLERMKNDVDLRDIPVIVISAVDEIDSVVRCIEMGAEDYLPKPFNPVLLRARLTTSLQRKKLRDLEKAYLQQEVMLRQNEKLATLGKMSAGMAHELNNPAAAARRSANQLSSTFSNFQDTLFTLSVKDLDFTQLEDLAKLAQFAKKCALTPIDLDPMQRSDREFEHEKWLDELGVDNGWEIAPVLVNMGLKKDEAEAMIQSFNPSSYSVVLQSLCDTFTIFSLIEELTRGVSRISAIVQSLKSYSYMDQAPVQSIDIHVGLDNTLVMLQSKIKPGTRIHRHYASDLPCIQAYGSELNQVWTNIIDNALDIVDGNGEITLRTQNAGSWIIVEIEDNGPGIPAEIQGKIFDPFFTTKPVGKGTGLGLTITYSIIDKHNGKISARSKPGSTVFEVRLPLELTD